MQPMPEWDIPNDLQAQLDADDGGMWEDHRWAPILLTVMKGTSYGGRDIPLAWQIEFDPSEPSLAASSEKILQLGVEPDGYGWANVLSSVIEKYHPEILNELQFGDTDIGSCVVWVESEATCRQLIQIVWTLIRQHE